MWEGVTNTCIHLYAITQSHPPSSSYWIITIAYKWIHVYSRIATEEQLLLDNPHPHVLQWTTHTCINSHSPTYREREGEAEREKRESVWERNRAERGRKKEEHAGIYMLSYLSRLRQQIKWKRNGHKMHTWVVLTNIRLKKTPVFVSWWFGVPAQIPSRFQTRG